jgi:hypothetical protein
MDAVDRTTGVTTFDEAAIQADLAQKWKAMLSGAVNYEAFSIVGDCLFVLLAGQLGAIMALRFERGRVPTSTANARRMLLSIEASGLPTG